MLLSLDPNIIVHVENVVSLFSSPSTSSQKVRKCGGHKFLSLTGCMAERLKKKILETDKMVDLVAGPGQCT